MQPIWRTPYNNSAEEHMLEKKKKQTNDENKVD